MKLQRSSELRVTDRASLFEDAFRILKCDRLLYRSLQMSRTYFKVGTNSVFRRTNAKRSQTVASCQIYSSALSTSRLHDISVTSPLNLQKKKHLSSLPLVSFTSCPSRNIAPDSSIPSLSLFLPVSLLPCVTCPVSISEAASWKTICSMYLFSPLCGCLN